MAVVTRNEYHSPDPAVISATRLHPATAEDSIVNSESLIRFSETENPEYEEDKSKISPDDALTIESSWVSDDSYVVARYDTGSG